MTWRFQFERIITPPLRHLFKNHSYTIRAGIAKGLKRKGGLGFLPFKPLTAEDRLLSHLDLTGQTVYDIGGWEGVFTLFFARAVGREGLVVTFEPHPENCRRIRENVGLNGFQHVQIRQLALGKGQYETNLAFRLAESASGSINLEHGAHILQERGTRVIPVQVDSLDHYIAMSNLPLPDFVKIDVEGAEQDVLAGMAETIKRSRPSLWIEIHGEGIKNKIENARQVVDLIVDTYTLYHVESRQAITRANANIAREGHLYCS